MRKALLAATALWPVTAFAQTTTTSASLLHCPSTSQATTTPAGTVASTGWSVSNGKIYLNGEEFIAHGIAVANTDDLQALVTNAQGQPLLSTFQNVNYVRIPVFDMSSASEALLQPYIATLTALGIVVEIGDTNYPGVATGSDLTKAEQWYSAMAASTNGNPLLIFSTENEPAQDAGAGAINAMVSGIYQAIRSTGNKTLIIIGPDSSSSMSITEAMLGSMTDVAFTLHFYNWLTKYSTDLGANEAELAKEAAYMRSFTSADGQMPVVIQEYGDSTDGKNDIDPGGYETVQAVHNSGLGTVAWAYWNYGMAGDDAIDGSGDLTTYGQMIQQHLTQMASSSAPASGSYNPASFTQQLCNLSAQVWPGITQTVNTAVQQAEQRVQRAQYQLQKVTQPAGSSAPAAAPQVASIAPATPVPASAAPSASIPSIAVTTMPSPAKVSTDQPAPTVTQADTTAADTAIVTEINAELAGVQAQIQQVEDQLTTLAADQTPAASVATPTLTPPLAAPTTAVAPPPDNSSTGGSEGGDGGGGDAQ